MDESKLSFPSFFSEQTNKATLLSQPEEQRTSLENLIQATKDHLEATKTKNGFRLQAGSMRATHLANKTKSEMEEKDCGLAYSVPVRTASQFWR